MKLSEFKKHLNNLSELVFAKENGTIIPKHFHVTEIGQIDKRFMDCGGTTRTENLVSMQLWESIDVWHRLSSEKFSKIIDLAQEKLQIEDLEIEIAYQGATIENFAVSFENNTFILVSKATACLANDACGIVTKTISNCCKPGSNCC
jgi:Family of unknown function (DUF6428)